MKITEIDEIVVSFEYQGEFVQFSKSPEDLIQNDDSIYCLFKDEISTHDEYEDPYFEVNFKPIWNDNTKSYGIEQSGYVNHFKDTCETNPDWQTDDVTIEFI